MMLIYETDKGIQGTLTGSEKILRSMIAFLSARNLVRRTDGAEYYLTDGAGYWEKVFC